ncbi:hypothetical protein LCGC14_2582760, partial [marine sediment metagenome]
MPWETETRRYIKSSGSQAYGSTSPLRWRLDKDGILAGIYLEIRGTLSGSGLGSLNALGLIVLSDPRGAQPVYEPAPTVRGEVLDKYPELASILDPV